MFCRCLPGGGPTPFGGPAAGLWPRGSGPQAPAASAAAAAPSPAPAPQCQAASLFSDCFTNGNVGWTVVTPAGTVTFTGGKINEGSSGGNPQGQARKALASVPSGAWTASFKLTEIAAAPTAGMNYAVGMFNSAGDSVFALVLIGDGSVFAGDMTDIYFGAWTPSAGATHTVRLTRTGPGTLTLSIDGVNIPLTPIAPGPITGTAGVVDLSIQNNDLSGMGAYDEVFLTDGIADPALRFCCPEESP